MIEESVDLFMQVEFNFVLIPNWNNGSSSLMDYFKFLYPPVK